MATKYTFNVNSPFFQGPQPKPEDRTSSNPFGLSFGGGYSDTLTKMNERFNLLISDNLKSLYSFLDDKALDRLNPQNLFKKDAEKSNPLEDSNTKEKNKFNLGKTLLNGVSSIGRGIGNFTIDTGIWKDFNPDKGIFGEDEDGKRTFDLGQAVGNGVGNIGRGLGFASQFLPQQEMADNVNNKVAQGMATTIGTAAIKSGNPWAALYGGALLAGQKLGINNSGSDTGNELVDYGNSALALIPGLGLLGKKAGLYNEDALVNSSHSYNNIGELARKNSNGRFLINGNGIRNQIKDANFKTYIASNDILRPGKLDIIGALDPKYYIAALNELNGGYNLVGVAKLGSILQFSKRTLSKLKISKHLIGGKVKEMSEIIDKVPEKLSLIPLDEYLQQKRQVWIDKAIQKASTRNAPYMFKNKDWKNCIATAFDSYGLYDKNGMPLVIRNADFAADPNKYGFTELPFGDNIDHLPDGVLIQDYNNPKDRTVPGHAIILTGRDEDGVPIYSWSSGNNEIEDMHPLARLYSFYWTDKVKPKAYQFIGTPEQISQWINEYKQMYNLSDDDIKAFKEGGKVNVIPSGALHAHKHNLTEVAEDGEKFEDVTTKGIPVVVEDEKGNLIQQAEVEREEIIFRLEVTKKLEELSKKHTDEAAIEAGKLLVKEILYNTEDNTGEML